MFKKTENTVERSIRKNDTINGPTRTLNQTKNKVRRQAAFSIFSRIPSDSEAQDHKATELGDWGYCYWINNPLMLPSICEDLSSLCIPFLSQASCCTAHFYTKSIASTHWYYLTLLSMYLVVEAMLRIRIYDTNVSFLCLSPYIPRFTGAVSYGQSSR